MSTFKHFMMIECPVHVVPTCTSVWKRAWRATARLQHRCEREIQSKLNVLADRKTTCFFRQSRDSPRQAASEWHTAEHTVARFAPGKHLAWSLMHSRDPLLAHGLSVKLSPFLCSHSSPAGRIAVLSACGVTYMWAFLLNEICYSLRLAPGWCSSLCKYEGGEA